MADRTAVGCLDGASFLAEAMELGVSADYDARTNLAMMDPSFSHASADSGGEVESEEAGEDEEEVGDIAQIFLSNNGPQKAAPSDGERRGDERQVFISFNFLHFSPGWTMGSADSYCGSLIRGSEAASTCSRVDSIDVASGEKIRKSNVMGTFTAILTYVPILSVIVNCRTQLLFTGDSRVANLHLDRLERECREEMFRNQR